MAACGSCLGSVQHHLNPTNWDFSEKKVTKVALVALLFSAVALTACALITAYPAASSAFITTFSIAAVVSLAALCVVLVKKCQTSSTVNARRQQFEEVHTPPPPKQQHQQRGKARPRSRDGDGSGGKTGSLAGDAHTLAENAARLAEKAGAGE